MDLFVTILVAVLTTISTLIAEKSSLRLWNRMSLKIRELRWKAQIPKLYRNRDIIIQLRKGSEVTVLGDRYEVTGLTMIVSGGEKRFEFWIKKDDHDRWLEFSEDEIILWGDWTDQEIWRESKGERKIEWPHPITVVAVENRTSTSLEIGGFQTTLDEIILSATAQNLWGGWETGYPVYEKIDYGFARGIINEKQPRANKRKMFVAMEIYGTNRVFTDYFVGVNLEDSEVVPGAQHRSEEEKAHACMPSFFSSGKLL